MPTKEEKAGKLRRLWEWIVGHWVSNVPAEIMVCEFECKKEQCLQGEWDTCEHRILRSAEQLLSREEDRE